MIEKRTISAAEAFRKSLLNGAKTLIEQKQMKSDNPKDIGVKRAKYKYVYLQRVMLCAIQSPEVGELFATNGHIALGPLPIGKKLRNILRKKTILPFGDPPSLSSACPPLHKILEDPEAEKQIDTWKVSYKTAIFNGKLHNENYAVLSNDTRINIIYFLAAAMHVDPKNEVEKVAVYQNPEDLLSPVLFTGPSGNYAVTMPIRID